MDFYENKVDAERAVLISVDTGEFDVDSSLAELTELARTAGAEVICEMTQKREAPEPGTYLGKGKLQELSDYCELEKPDVIIIDGELSPAQQRNIETITEYNFNNLVVGQIIKCEKHPGSDHLNICIVDVGNEICDNSLSLKYSSSL